ncbi:translation elongation factor-like protein [Candidatus Omnitrophota bacterium]
MEEKQVGTVEHFYGKPSVGMIKLSDVLKIGDKIHIKGNATDFTQVVSSMRIEFTDTKEAKAGDLVGIKVDQKVHKLDAVFQVTD